jgi:DNA-binding CsgD family transcriptional regulator
MHHERISWWRRRRPAEYPVADLPEAASTPDIAQATADRVTVAHALRGLSPRQRAVVVLRYYEDLTEAETARTLGLSVGTVKRHGHDALARLRDALHAHAAQAPAYHVSERALATARRRKWLRLGSAAGVLVLIAALVIGGIQAVRRQALPPADGGQVSIPDRVAAPPRGHPQAADSPPGPASVLFGGTGWNRLSDIDGEGDLAVVGASTDSYRIIYGGYEAPAGQEAMLSPDGGTVALSGGFDPRGLGLLNLRTGKTRYVGEPLDPSSGDMTYPLAWSHDGKTLAISRYLGNSQWSFFLLDLASGKTTRIPDSLEGNRGWNFAFSPDDSRFAFTAHNETVIMDRNFQVQHRISQNSGLLAGKGAWTPDGTGIVLLGQNPSGWQLARFNLNGAPEGPVWTVKQDLLLLIRLLGWDQRGNPIVVAIHHEPGAPVGRGFENLGYHSIHSVSLLTLTPQGEQTILTAPHLIMSIDVSDEAIASGNYRSGMPPTFGLTTVLLTAGTGAGVALAVLVVIRRRGRTASRWKSSSAPSGTQS